MAAAIRIFGSVCVVRGGVWASEMPGLADFLNRMEARNRADFPAGPADPEPDQTSAAMVLNRLGTGKLEWADPPNPENHVPGRVY